MKIDIITLFPGMFKGAFEESILKRAIKKGCLDLKLHNLRDYSSDKHKKVDDKPFGGGPGMVLQVRPIFDAVSALRKKETKVILLSPQGRFFRQKHASKLAKEQHIILLCGHYEGVDDRVREYLVDEEISIGDYVLTGGEIPAMVLVDSIARLIPGVLGNEKSIIDETFCDKLIEYPQYTRPSDFKGMKVPEVLLSGDHKKIKLWRKKQSIKKTKRKRPELLKSR